MEYISSSSFVLNEKDGSVVGIVNGCLVTYPLPSLSSLPSIEAASKTTAAAAAAIGGAMDRTMIKLKYHIPRTIYFDCILLPSTIPPPQQQHQQQENDNVPQNNDESGNNSNPNQVTNECFYAIGHHHDNKSSIHQTSSSSSSPSSCYLLSIHPKTGSVFHIPNHHHHHNDNDLPNDFLPTSFLHCSNTKNGSDSFILVGTTARHLKKEEEEDENLIMPSSSSSSRRRRGRTTKQKKKRCTLLYHGCIQRNHTTHEEDEEQNSTDNTSSIPFAVHWTRAKIIMSSSKQHEHVSPPFTTSTSLKNKHTPKYDEGSNNNHDIEKDVVIDNVSHSSFVASFPFDCHVSCAYYSHPSNYHHHRHPRGDASAVMLLNPKKQNINGKRESGVDNHYYIGGVCLDVVGTNSILLESWNGGASWTIRSPTFPSSGVKQQASSPRDISNGVRNVPPVLAFMPPPPLSSSPSLLNSTKEEEKERLFAFGYEEEQCRLTEMKYILRSKQALKWPKLNVYECKTNDDVVERW